MLNKIIRFITTDIWRIQLRNLSPTKSFFIRHLRIFILAIRGFNEDKCQLIASALTFYSLLSIVPVIAVVFGIAKGFGLEDTLKEQIIKVFHGYEEIAMHIIDFTHSLLKQTRGDLVAGIGVILLFWTVIRVLSGIEQSFNDIWGVKKARSFGRQITDYLSLLLVGPILLIMSSSATIVLTGRIESILQKAKLLNAINFLVIFIIKLLPFFIILALFVFIYIFIPNTKVRFRSALLAGFIASLIYILVQKLYIASQRGIAEYNAIYGSFAALPLFLLWLNTSWLIVLFGAELSFAHQNVETYEFEPDCLQISYSFKKLLTLRITHLLIKNFAQGEGALSPSQISHKLGIPIRLVQQILYELVEAKIVSEMLGQDGRSLTYQPGIDTEKLTVKYVIDALENRGSDKIPVIRSNELEEIANRLRTFSETLEKSPANIPLKNI